MEKRPSINETKTVRMRIVTLKCDDEKLEKTSLTLLLQRRGCPVSMQHMVGQQQSDSCLDSSEAQNAQRVSLATPPKLWQALEVDIFELLCTLYGRRLQTVVVFMLSGRETSAAF